MELFQALKKRSKSYDSPFRHWEISRPLTNEAIKEICDAEILVLLKSNNTHCSHSEVHFVIGDYQWQIYME